MKKHLYLFLGLFCPFLIYSQNAGVGTPTPLMKLHVADSDSPVLLLENTQTLDLGVSTSMYFKIGDGSYPYTGGIKTIGTGSNVARLGFFTYAAPSANGLIERMSILDNGNVGLGTINPLAKLEVDGEIKADSINLNSGPIRNLQNPISAQDVATKAYVDLLEAKVAELEGVLDVNQNRYEIVTVGTQTWMAENLKTICYNDSTLIPIISNTGEWTTASTNSSPASCWYNNNGANQDSYGLLYNWYTINSSTNGNKNVCPTGWHVPTDGEWDILRDYLDSSASGNNNVAGGKIKEAGLAHWDSPNTGATNESALRGIPGGFRDFLGTFNNIGTTGLWWSSTTDTPSEAKLRYTNLNSETLFGTVFDKGSGLSVRCIKDD